jgi:hypothetical protein
MKEILIEHCMGESMKGRKRRHLIQVIKWEEISTSHCIQVHDKNP